MSHNEQFRELRRKIYLSYHQDGLIDIIIGFLTLGFGMNVATDSSAWSLLGWMPIIFYVPLKNQITVPRFGYFKFDTAREAQRRKGILGFLIMGGLVVFLVFVLGMVMFLLSDSSPPPAVLWMREYPLLLYGLLGALIFGLAGLIGAIRRLLVYALLSLFIMISGQVLGTQQFVPFLLLGGAIFVVGVVLLVRFLRKYPITPEEEIHVSE